jgi:hypothetical protein
VTAAERRARVVRRHHLGGTAADAEEAVRGVVALHSSDPVTPHLAARARIAGFASEDLDRALYRERSLWRLHAMRRTLFIVPADEAGVFAAAAGFDVARRERAKLEAWLGAVMDPRKVPKWLRSIEARVLDVLVDGKELRSGELAAEVPELRTELTVGSGKWAGRLPLSSRLLNLLAMEGRLVRARPAGSWRSSQYHWATAPEWFGEALPDVDAEAGRAKLARRYLAGHGPATLVDLRWWTGWTAGRARAALRAVEAVAVDLDDGGEGFVLAGDLDTVSAPDGGRVAFLPGLDPTPMGWKERDWYLGPHAGLLFDRNGNAGPTIWVDGRVVGGWAQRADGRVVHRLLEDVGRETAAKVEAEADVVTGWLAGVTVTPRFRTPLELELTA